MSCGITKVVDSRERCGKNASIIIVIRPIFIAEVVLDSKCKSDAKLQDFYLLTLELSGGKCRRRCFSENVGGVIFGRR